MTKLSVIMSVYNDAQYLKEAVDSVLNQTFKNFEFIIINDASVDNSGVILQAYQKKDSRIILIKNQSNIGLTKSLNKGLRLAKGEYIARMDSDDISHKNRFPNQIDFLDKNKEIAVVGSFAKIIDENGRITGEHKPPMSYAQIKRAMFFAGQICHPSVMFRRQIILDQGGYDENFKYAQDYDLWFRLMKKLPVANISEFLLSWRDSASGIGREKQKDQHYFAQKARKRAIKSGLYPKSYYLFLFWPRARKVIPQKIRIILKKAWL